MAGFAIDVIIVNYRTGPLVVECLRSLWGDVVAHAARRGRVRVSVVDNASADGSADLIEAAIAEHDWGKWASVIRSPVNGGFSHGTNQVLQARLADADKPDAVWLLNPDTEIRTGALHVLSDFLSGNPAIGIIGSMIELADGTPWPYAFRFPSILGEFERGIRLGPVSRLLKNHNVLREMGEDPEPVDWVSGCSMVVRREVFEKVGLLDPGYFLYFEETDFCRAASRAGWPIWYVPDAVIMHIAGQSTGVTGADAGKRRLPGYWFESRRRYFVKNHGRAYAVLADAAWLTGHLLWRARRWLQSLDDPDPPYLVRDFLSNSAFVAGESPRTPVESDRMTVSAEAGLAMASAGA